VHGAHVPPEKNGQPVHAAEPVALFHLATSHAVQTPPSGPVKPALQVHVLDEIQPLHDAPVFDGHAIQVAASVAPVVVEYMPAPQLVHNALPVLILYLPATHAEQTPPLGPVKPTLHVQAARTELETRELEPAGHATQVVATVAPVVVEYVAAAQSVHTALPVLILYLPGTHAEHTPPFGPVKPTLHVQAARAELEIGALEPAGHATQVVAIVAPDVVEYVAATQSVHVALPVLILYLPGTHAEQTPPLGPVKPTLQVQATRTELEIGELEPAGHVTQVVATVAPGVVEYVAAAQSVHTALPVLILYFPGTHAEQTPLSGPVKPTLHVQAARAELEIGELEPAGQATQVVATVAPDVVEYVAAAQSVHTALPVLILYLPIVHEEQTPPFGPVKPTLQVQAARAELEIGELEPAGQATQVVAIVAPVVVEYVAAAQSVQAALPAMILYLPGTQRVHAPPSGPVYPTLHVQAVRAELGIGEFELVGHVMQVAAAVAPVVMEYFAAVQSLHNALPVPILYLPAMQVVHTPPSGPVKPTLQVQAVRVELGLGELELSGHAMQVV
jgi:hypothetical protein